MKTGRVKMKTLVIAEKPSVGRDIARVLHCSKDFHGGKEGKDYIVTWALGHLITLKDPEDYEKKYKEWKMEDLPILPKRLETTVISKTGKQYQVVKAQIHRKEVKEIVIATDSGREGELVARWILEMANNQKPCKRLWISSVTDRAIKEGFSKLKDAREYDSLYEAALSRAEADWLVGINGTRALTCKYNAQLSCGRVQTPTLAMIEEREEEIRTFQSRTYYGIKTSAGGWTFTWKENKTGNSQSFDKEKINQQMKELSGLPLIIEKIEKKEKKIFPPLPYDLTKLQEEANERFGYSPKETLNIMQRLYEHYKVVTYPRTDSPYLTSDLLDSIQERLLGCGTGPYKAYAKKLWNKTWKKDASFINDKKVKDHHGIIPTEEPVRLEEMSLEERKIYDLVVRRFLSSLYPPYSYGETTIKAKIGQERFETKEKVTLEKGWKEVINQEKEEEDKKVFTIKEGEVFQKIVLDRVEGSTNPPLHFTESTLLSAMENPIKYMKNKEKNMVKIIGEKGGLGTVATRADIIEKLFQSFLIEKKGKEIHLTSKAKQLLKLVPEDLKKPELTGSWELKLSKMEEGTMKRETFMAEIRQYTKEILKEIQAEEKTFSHDNVTNKKCPQCGKRLLAVKGKNAKLLVCQDRNCGYRETLSRMTNARCPLCHKKMEMSKKGEEDTFFCACGYRERLSKFEERRKKEGAGVRKKDVANYLKKQQEEAKNTAYTPFAEALKKLQEKD